MAMYHANHPSGSYEMTNRVAVFDPDRDLTVHGAATFDLGDRAVGRGPLGSAGPVRILVHELRNRVPDAAEVPQP